MKRGDQFVAKLRLKKLMLVLYTVRHCVASGRDQFKIGAELCGVINDPHGLNNLTHI
jgi:hypothetical protein